MVSLLGTWTTTTPVRARAGRHRVEVAADDVDELGVLGAAQRRDDVRGVDDGQGIQFTMAWALSEVTQLQVATSYINFDTGLPATDFYRSAASIELVRYFNPRGFAPFMVTGVGVAYNDIAHEGFFDSFQVATQPIGPKFAYDSPSIEGTVPPPA